MFSVFRVSCVSCVSCVYHCTPHTEAALSLRDLQQAAGSGVEHSDPSSTSGRSTGTDNPEDTNVIKEKLGL